MLIFNEYFFPYKHYGFGIPLRCNNNTVIDGQLTALKITTLKAVILLILYKT